MARLIFGDGKKDFSYRRTHGLDADSFRSRRIMLAAKLGQATLLMLTLVGVIAVQHAGVDQMLDGGFHLRSSIR